MPRIFLSLLLIFSFLVRTLGMESLVVNTPTEKTASIEKSNTHNPADNFFLFISDVEESDDINLKKIFSTDFPFDIEILPFYKKGIISYHNPLSLAALYPILPPTIAAFLRFCNLRI